MKSTWYRSAQCQLGFSPRMAYRSGVKDIRRVLEDVESEVTAAARGDLGEGCGYEEGRFAMSALTSYTRRQAPITILRRSSLRWR